MERWRHFRCVEPPNNGYRNYYAPISDNQNTLIISKRYIYFFSADKYSPQARGLG